MRELAHTDNYGLQELLRVSCADPMSPDSNDLAFGVAPRINAAGRIDHPARSLSVLEAARDEGTLQLELLIWCDRAYAALSEI